MTVFSFTHKGIFVMGEVLKERELICYGETGEAPEEPEYRERWVVRSDVYPGYVASAAKMTAAVNAYRDGIDEHIETRKRFEEDHEHPDDE